MKRIIHKLTGRSHDDMEALVDVKRVSLGGTVQSRHEAARKPIKASDRRFKLDKRDKQYNTNVTSELFDEVAAAMEAHDLTKAELTERALRMYLDHLASGGE